MVISADFSDAYSNKVFAHSESDDFLRRRIATQVRVLRTQRGMSQGDLALLTGITPSRISQIENGHYEPSFSVLARLAVAFDVTLSISFETFGSMIETMRDFRPLELQRASREEELYQSAKAHRPEQT